MNLLMAVGAGPSEGASLSLVLVLVVGFVAAAGIGSIAWFNSKKPVGWKDKEKPDIVPDVDKN